MKNIKRNTNIKNTKIRYKKLDQETWLCRTHLDDFIVKIWTILDHTRTRLSLVIKAILLNLWSILLYHLGQLKTIEDYLRPYWTIYDHFKLIWIFLAHLLPISDILGQYLTILGYIGSLWIDLTIWDHLGQCWTNAISI